MWIRGKLVPWYVNVNRHGRCHDSMYSRIRFENQVHGEELTLTLFFPCCRCSCGNCNRVFLQNLSECYCCNELDGCKEAMSSELVLQDLPEGTTIKCITDHPGFKPVCLEKWSLRMAADKFCTKTKQRYQQTGTEERWGWRTCVCFDCK